MKGDLFMKISKAKLKRLAKIMKVIFDVFFWAAVVLGAISFLIFIVTFFIPENIFILSKAQVGSISIISGIIEFKIDPNLYNNINFKPFLQAILPMTTVISLMFLIIVNNLRLILKTIANDCPFERSNSKRLLIIGIVLMIGSVVLNFVEGIVALAIIDMLKIKNIDVIFTVDGAMLLTGFLILILAGVFRYGSYLQEEYDATL